MGRVADPARIRTFAIFLINELIPQNANLAKFLSEAGQQISRNGMPRTTLTGAIILCRHFAIKVGKTRRLIVGLGSYSMGKELSIEIPPRLTRSIYAEGRESGHSRFQSRERIKRWRIDGLHGVDGSHEKEGAEKFQRMASELE